MAEAKVLSDVEKQNEAIVDICREFAVFLKGKNTSYSGSAFRDVRVGGKVIPADDAINVRIADKLKRLESTDPNFDGEDAWKDLCGYLIIKMALKKL